MKKITKKDRVENYLENLMKTDGFTTENLMNMTVYDLFGNAELEGIGKTTLSGALNSFKQKYGLKKPGKGGLIPVKNTKKERVERYLAKLMKSPEFGVDDLMNLTVYDLFGNLELEGIGKTTLSSGISAFKKKYLKIQYSNENVAEEAALKALKGEDHDDFGTGEESESTAGPVTESDDDDLAEDENLELSTKAEDVLESEEEADEEEDDEEEDQSFEDVFINVIGKGDKKEKEKPKDTDRKKSASLDRKKLAEPVKIEDTSLNMLNYDEIATIKTMISRFKTGKMNIVPPENLELIELKHALRHFGVDYKTILEHYRKNVDK
ncbi:hypothetical protein KKI24_12210 [bacterium]|nr:hypothetical protein [bacterium]